MNDNCTPAPWSVNTDPNHDRGEPWTIWGPQGPGHGFVTHLAPWCQVNDSERERKIADAHLISTAPELLRVCERLLALAEADATHCTCEHEGQDTSVECPLCQLLTYAEVALNKANGATP